MQKIISLLSTSLITAVAGAAGASTQPHHPAFLRKLANPSAYTVNAGFGVSESICGTSNLQHVSEYDGSRGQPVEFVAKYEPSVGAMAKLTPPKDVPQTAPLTRKYCSGTLIGPDLFLTASHCVGNTVLNEYVVFNYQKMRGTDELAEPALHKIIAVLENGKSLDYAILKLEGTPGDTFGYKHIRAQAVENNHLITIIQHPKGNPKMVDVGHKLRDQGDYMRYGDLDTEPGSSGSGILDQDGYVAGVHTLGGCYTNGGSNAGVLMTRIAEVSKIVQELTAPPAQPPAEPPPQPEPPVTPQPPATPPVVIDPMDPFDPGI